MSLINEHSKNSFWRILIGVISLCIGLFFARLKFIEFDNKINIIDLIQVIVTLLFGALLPVLINKIIDDSKGVKHLIIDEMTKFLDETKKIKLFLHELNRNGIISGDDKDKIRAMINDSELLITSVTEQMNIAFKCEKLKKRLNDEFLKYQYDVAGGELMNSNFTKINYQYLNSTNVSHAHFDTEVKKMMQEVYKI